MQSPTMPGCMIQPNGQVTYPSAMQSWGPMAFPAPGLMTSPNRFFMANNGNGNNMANQNLPSIPSMQMNQNCGTGNGNFSMQNNNNNNNNNCNNMPNNNANGNANLDAHQQKSPSPVTACSQSNSVSPQRQFNKLPAPEYFRTPDSRPGIDGMNIASTKQQVQQQQQPQPVQFQRQMSNFSMQGSDSPTKNGAATAANVYPTGAGGFYLASPDARGLMPTAFAPVMFPYMTGSTDVDGQPTTNWPMPWGMSDGYPMWPGMTPSPHAAFMPMPYMASAPPPPTDGFVNAAANMGVGNMSMNPHDAFANAPLCGPTGIHPPIPSYPPPPLPSDDQPIVYRPSTFCATNPDPISVHTGNNNGATTNTATNKGKGKGLGADVGNKQSTADILIPPRTGAKTVLLSYIPRDIDDDGLAEAIHNRTDVVPEQVVVMRDPEKLQSRCFAFVTLNSTDEAVAVLRKVVTGKFALKDRNEKLWVVKGEWASQDSRCKKRRNGRYGNPFGNRCRDKENKWSERDREQSALAAAAAAAVTSSGEMADIFTGFPPGTNSHSGSAMSFPSMSHWGSSFAGTKPPQQASSNDHMSSTVAATATSNNVSSNKSSSTGAFSSTRMWPEHLGSYIGSAPATAAEAQKQRERANSARDFFSGPNSRNIASAGGKRTRGKGPMKSKYFEFKIYVACTKLFFKKILFFLLQYLYIPMNI